MAREADGLVWPSPEEDLDATRPGPLERATDPPSCPAEEAPAAALVEVVELDARTGPAPYVLDLRTPRPPVIPAEPQLPAPPSGADPQEPVRPAGKPGTHR
jgi:hypothetical protein